ncbi:MAG TPA: SAM-dependent methyltransferase [Kofleriaceae bacterium]|nr:SAM-dependent methyltransferase [Kofleriaceae bacterium]
MASEPVLPARLRRSQHLSWFTHLGAVYLFHDLYGYLMEMSSDIADMIQSFDTGVDTAETIEYYRGRLGDADPRQFVDVLAAHAVLVDPSEDEIEGLWAFVPIKAKWNVWQRRDDRLTLWTAWGERPVSQLFLDPEETKLWDAFDGTKRLIEMRHHHDNAKLIALVRRLVHSDVQALKLSMMPAAVYAKRPAMAPAYLTSTMPYARWTPGTPVPAAPMLSAGAGDAGAGTAAEPDQHETTLSHLLRVPHPALRGRTYGEALADVLLARGAVPEGRVRVLEIGPGQGYVARDVIARLGAAGREVAYTIVEVSPTLAAAQRERLGDTATWIEGDVLGEGVRARLVDGLYDLVIANEVVGDLPAQQVTRADLGLGPEDGTVDRAKLRALGPGAALAADLGVSLDDATEPAYLQTGAWQLMAQIARWLAPGGTAVVTDFGDAAGWPKLVTNLDVPELSTHFGQLLQLARGAGLVGDVQFVIDLLDFDRAQQGLATTRSHFRALRALAADAGVELAKIGYTPELLAAAVGDKLDLGAIGELRWDKIEDRLMGIVPHELRALVVSRTA